LSGSFSALVRSSRPGPGAHWRATARASQAPRCDQADTDVTKLSVAFENIGARTRTAGSRSSAGRPSSSTRLRARSSKRSRFTARASRGRSLPDAAPT